MKKINVQPTFLINHVRLYGAAYRDQILVPNGPPSWTPREPA